MLSSAPGLFRAPQNSSSSKPFCTSTTTSAAFSAMSMPTILPPRPPTPQRRQKLIDRWFTASP